jgi:hypothetical protein
MTVAKTWAGALCVFAVYSFLWKENRFFRAFQNLYVGLAAGYSIVLAVTSIQRQAWVPLTTKGDIWAIVPMILGLLLFTRLFKRYAWVARWPMAFLMGMGAALSMKAIESDFVRQIQASLVAWNSINNLMLSLGTALALTYFFFTFKPNAVTNYAGRAGRWVLMLCFGAAFGQSVQGRLSLLISQMQFLLKDWMHVMK